MKRILEGAGLSSYHKSLGCDFFLNSDNHDNLSSRSHVAAVRHNGTAQGQEFY